MDPKEVISQLNKYEFHDLPVLSIEFVSNPPDTKICITTTPYNEASKDYDKLKLTFFKILESSTDHFFGIMILIWKLQISITFMRVVLFVN
jgi:hypothetical protein